LALSASVLKAVGAEPERRRRRVIKHHWGVHFKEPWRERMFLATASFLVTFSLARLITHSVRRHAGKGSLKNFTIGGAHVHHLAFGIGILHLTGYILLAGLESLVRVPWAHRSAAIGYGAGAAMTLDEFALWMRLEDVYWTREGRKSIDAVAIFASFLMASIWGAGFFRGVVRDLIWLRDFERRHYEGELAGQSTNGDGSSATELELDTVSQPSSVGAMPEAR
jgi:hypothetical protein